MPSVVGDGVVVRSLAKAVSLANQGLRIEHEAFS